MKKPNLFILGAAKCGTTSLAYYLGQHPDIFMSPIKEPVFFNDGFQVVDNPIDYYNLFSDVKNEKVIGEASHAYMTNPRTAEVLALLFPDAKFIITLRDPVERAYSLYKHMKRHGYESIKTFEQAIMAEDERCNSMKFRKNCKEYFYNYLYYRSGLYGEQIKRYLEYFDKEQFFFLTLEQLENNPGETMLEIFLFLGVDASFPLCVEPKNVAPVTVPRNLKLYRVLVQMRAYLPLNKYCVKSLKNIISKKTPKLSDDTRSALEDRYINDMTLLKKLTGIDFLKLSKPSAGHHGEQSRCG